MRAVQRRSVVVDDLEIEVWNWPGDDPALVFAHATGFHGRCWDRVIEMFPGRHCVALDFRGHGHSSKPEPPNYWAGFVLDMHAVVEGLGLWDAVGIGHSMGGHTVVAAQCFAAMVLVDPTIFPKHMYDGGERYDASFIRRRRNRWKSVEEMFERFRGRAPFESWRPEILHDYCEYGLLPDGDELVLACPPDVEASIYEHSREPASNLHPILGSVTVPVTVMRAGVPMVPGTFNLAASPTASDLASEFPHGRDVLLTGRNHFIPMEAPELVADEIRRVISDRKARSGGCALP